MATNVILPALGMAQENGTIVRWLKDEGEQVTKGEPIAEIETDKATVEIEAPASGILTTVAAAGETVPVGQVIARIASPGESASTPPAASGKDGMLASPLASRIAAEHQLDLRLVQSSGRRIQKADVMSYLQSQEHQGQPVGSDRQKLAARLLPASPKARRLALESGANLAAISGTGPGGAVLAADVRVASAVPAASTAPVAAAQVGSPAELNGVIVEPGEMEQVGKLAATASELDVGTIWRVMAERTTQSWTGTPHFYLVREVNASRLVAWREQAQRRVEAGGAKITYTDLLVKVVAAALNDHPRANASWRNGKIVLQSEVHVGLAVAVEQGLVVPVIHNADRLSLREIAARRQELVAQAQAGKLRPADLQGGTFTISNLGMYGVDAFNAIINQPQAAILAVGRIAERVVPLHGQPAVQPVMVLTLSCDHRAIDGARGAQFLSTLADLLEEPLGLLA